MLYPRVSSLRVAGERDVDGLVEEYGSALVYRQGNARTVKDNFSRTPPPASEKRGLGGVTDYAAHHWSGDLQWKVCGRRDLTLACSVQTHSSDISVFEQSLG